MNTKSTSDWDAGPSQEEIAFLLEAGIVYRDMGRFADARQVFRGVKAMLPSKDVPVVMEGTVDFHERNFDSAKASYLRAIELNPRSAFAYAHLGEVELFRLDKEAARANLKKAIELDPRGESGQMARSLLELVSVVEIR